MPFAVEEVGLCRCVGVVVFDCLRDDEAIVFVEGNEVTVKRGVVGCGEAQAVFGIEAVLFVFRPRADVAGAKDIRYGESRHTAFTTVVRQHHFAEEVLIHAHLDGGKFRLAFFRSEIQMRFKVGF